MTDVDELFAVRPEEFVEARTALAKQLRAEGRKDEAATVAKLRRPSVGAWALNQVARSSPDVVEAAIAAGAELRSASEAAVAGDPGRLRAATTAERAAANAVVKAAAKHLGTRADALAPALLATIRVAALDDDVADELRRGVLVSDQEQPGFGFGLEGEVAVAPKSTPKPKARSASPAAKKLATAGATAKQAKADREAAEREKADRVAAREAERIRKKELVARQRDADRKAREAKRLAKEADAAEAEAREARVVADRAQAAADAAHRAVEELG